jgi:hypothetical protein
MSELPHWIEGARGAPSAHNTQPWRFTPRADGAVAVCWDPARELPVGDPTRRDLYLGLGAAVEAARLHAAGAGVSLRFEEAPDEDLCPVGTLVVGDGGAAEADAALAPLLALRQTGRAPHLRMTIPAPVIARLQAEARTHGCTLRVVMDRRRVGRLAALAWRATAAQFADRGVHAELYRWLRLDPQSPAYGRDGLTADCLELRGVTLALARLVMPPARMRLLSRLGLHYLVAWDTRSLVRRSACLCLLDTPSPGRRDLVETGRVLLRLWLIASEAGLCSHPVSALLDHALSVDPALAVFGATGAMPAAVFRLGACPSVARAPRLPAAELLEQEQA